LPGAKMRLLGGKEIQSGCCSQNRILDAVFQIAEHKRAAVADADQARFNKKIPLRQRIPREASFSLTAPWCQLWSCSPKHSK